MKPHSMTVRDMGFAAQALQRVANDLGRLGFNVGLPETNQGRDQDSLVRCVGFEVEIGRAAERRHWSVYLAADLGDRGRATPYLFLGSPTPGAAPYRFPANAGGADDLVTAIHSQASAFEAMTELYIELHESGLYPPETPELLAAS